MGGVRQGAWRPPTAVDPVLRPEAGSFFNPRLSGSPFGRTGPGGGIRNARAGRRALHDYQNFRRGLDFGTFLEKGRILMGAK